MTERPQVHRSKQESKDNTRLVMSAILMLVAFGAVTVLNIFYTQHAVRSAIRESNQKFCALFVGLDDRYRVSIPPGSEEFAKTVHDLREGLQCPATIVIDRKPTPSGE